MEHSIEFIVTISISFLAVAVVAAILLKKVKFPYTIGLVVIGYLWALAAQHFEPLASLRGLELSPESILFLILPPLIFDAAININLRLLLKNIVPILLLACVGIIISAAIIGAGLPLFTTLSLSGALLFGALISATDPVAVIALFNELKAPKRLVTLIDGESIFNDATAIVLFTIFLHSPINNYHDLSSNALPGLGSFIFVLCGGVAVGTAVGYAGSLLSYLNKGDMILQLTVSLITAYFSFVIADKFGLSGVISTLAAGLVFSANSETTVRRRHRESIHHFWEYFAFVANSFVFLLLGFTEFTIFKNPDTLKHSLHAILFAIPLIIIARGAVIYILLPLYNRFTRESNRVPKSYEAILLWGGLRGAVPVALAFSIPEGFPHREVIIQLTFGFILFTLLVQGTTIKKLMTACGVTPETGAFTDDEPVVTSTYPLANEYLATLVTKSLLDIFSGEGFFVSKEESGADAEYVISKRNIKLLLTRNAGEIKITSPERDLGYAKTVLYETLLEFDKSIQDAEAVVKPEELKKLMHGEIDEKMTPATAAESRQELNLLKYISADTIAPELPQGASKKEIISMLLDVLDRQNRLPNHDAAMQALLKREEQMSTGIGDGVALPHAKIHGIKDILAVVGISKEGIDFDALDGGKVHIVVLILSPDNKPVPHIQFMAAITKLLNDKERRERIFNAKRNAEIMEILRTKTGRLNLRRSSK